MSYRELKSNNTYYNMFIHLMNLTQYKKLQRTKGILIKEPIKILVSSLDRI